jgi:uncharacterized phage protein gp47/JayE
MTTYGITDEGFERKPHAVILQEIKDNTRLYCSEPELTLDDKDPIGALAHTDADMFDRLWKLAELCYYGTDIQNAEGFSLFALGTLIDLARAPARKGVMKYATCNFDAGKTFAIGDLVASVQGNDANRWVNAEAVTTTTSGDYPVLFESEGTGSDYTALAGTLTVIAQRKTGWNSITNATDAVAGKDAETEDEFRISHQLAVASQGNATPNAIKREVSKVDGVIDVIVYENDTDATVGGLPPHSIQVIVWDGAAEDADDDEIATAILKKAGGIESYGTTDSGQGTDANGNTRTVLFDRSEVIDLYCEIECTAPNGADEDAIKAALQGKLPTRTGDTVIVFAVRAAALIVAGVTDVPVFKLDTIFPPVNTSSNIAPSSTQRFQLDSSNITVTFT